MQQKIKTLFYIQIFIPLYIEKVYNIKKNAFTLIELIIVVTIIGILMLATTVYIGGSDEKRKVIEAQGCANTIGGEINNFVFYTLTSKHLKIDDNNTISPSHYIIQLTGCNTSGQCDKIDLSYDSGDSIINTYKTISVSNTCHQTKQPLRFYRTGNDTQNIEYIVMNKGLSPKDINDRNVFYIKTNSTTKFIIGDIITAVCISNGCANPKEIGKFRVDGRSQTISRKNCKFYDDDDPTKCKEREI